MSFHLGLGLGPLLGETIRDAASYDAAWIALAVSAGLGGIIATMLPHRPGDPEAPPSPWIHPAGIAPGIVAAFAIVGFVSFSTFVPLYAETIGLRRVGLVFTISSLAIAAARIIFSRAPDVLGPVKAATIAVVITIAGSTLVTVWAAPLGVYLGAAVLAGGMSLQTPSMIPIAVHGVSAQERASAMATFTMFMDVSVALTGPLMGLIVSGFGYRTAFATGIATGLIALALIRGPLTRRWNGGQLAPSAPLPALPI